MKIRKSKAYESQSISENGMKAYQKRKFYQWLIENMAENNGDNEKPG